MRIIQIAIDGPAGSGKSTVAKKVAEKLGFLYIDTGAMYRSIAWKALGKVSKVEDITSDFLKELAQNSDLTMSLDENKRNHFFIDGVEVTEEIRTPEVSRAVSWVAKDPNVRKALVMNQRKLGEQHSVVMDGRDIGTNVFPLAELKVFLTASVDERALRRWKEMDAKGEKINIEELKKEIDARDKMDQEREFAPLIPASDAIIVDTTSLTIDGVVEKLIHLYEESVK